MRYRVEFSPEAAEDLQRLFEHVLERELNSPTGDLEVAERALQAIKNGVELLALTPFSCRKVGSSPFLRELVIPFGASGYVALFEIVGSDRVIVGASRLLSEGPDTRLRRDLISGRYRLPLVSSAEVRMQSPVYEQNNLR